MRITTTTFVALAGVIFAQTSVGAGFSGAQNLVLYWGQNSYGQGSGNFSQQPLATYCQNTNIDVIPLAFITKITTGKGGYPEVNFANSGNQCTVFAGTNLWDCAAIGQDITTCQTKYNKTILVSIGGATYNEGGFTRQIDAQNNATFLWNTFGPKNASSSALRPFHDAVVDGFDIDVETKNSNFRAFGLQLRALMNADKSKPYYLTASPQCAYPDPNENAMFNDPNGGVPFDAVLVQFYNSAQCGVQTYNPNTSSQSNFTFQAWNNWATSGSANKNVKIFLGVPAGPSGASSGYQTAANLKGVINYCKGFSNFGGVMAWDASQAYANGNWLNDVKTIVRAAKTRRRGSNWRRVLELLQM